MHWLEMIKNAKAKQEDILAKAKEENRLFTDEEQAEFDAQQTEIDKATAMIEAEKKIQATNGLLGAPAEPEPISRVDVKPTDAPKWENGMGQFLQAVAVATAGGNRDERLVYNAALGGNEKMGTDGGFLVEPEHANGLIKRAYELAQVASRCARNTISSNRMTQNYVKETSRATGSRLGGVRGYWIDEAATITASAPTFGQIEWKLKKLAGLYYATEELLQDAVGLASFATEAFGEEFAWLLDDAVMNGAGASDPQGINNATCIVEVSKEAAQLADTIVYENIVAMWARLWARSRGNAVWFINQNCEPQLQTMAMVVGAGGVPVYMPAGGVAATPYSTLMGRPIIPIEQCKTVGDAGDIVLADMSQYQLVEKPGIKADESIHVQFLTDQRAFRFIYRVDGQPKWQSALTPANGTDTLSPFVRLEERA